LSYEICGILEKKDFRRDERRKHVGGVTVGYRQASNSWQRVKIEEEDRETVEAGVEMR
jgi:hypothetical protein